MLTVHHLNQSRSQRILWLMEEFEVPYEIKFYQRDATTNLAPPELKSVHPLGKSPVITDGDLIIAESGAIVDYVARRYGHGRLQPAHGTADYEKHEEWIQYAEGSATLPLMLLFYTMRLGEAAAPLTPRINDEIANHLGYVDESLRGRDYLMGSDLTAADIQMSWVGEMSKALGRLAAHPHIDAWVTRFHARPAYKRALEKGGPYNIGQ